MRTAKNDMRAGERKCEESWVEDRGRCRSNNMKGKCESDCGGNEVCLAT